MQPRVRISLVLLIGIMAAFTGPDVLIGPFLQINMGIDTAQVGLLLMIPAIATLPGTLIAPLLMRYMSPAGVISASLLCACVGLLVVLASVNSIPGMIAGLCLVAFGSPAMVVTSQLVVTSAPVERTGTMTAVQDVSNGLGAASGIAVLGGVGAYVFSRSIASLELFPGGRAPGTPGEAVALAEAEPVSARDEAVATVHAAMADSLQVSFFVGAVLVIACALLCATSLRHVDRAR